MTPENINAAESIDALRKLNPHLAVIVAYGQILKPEVLALPEKGCLNLHASLLPKYRGAAPIQWAIARGEQKTGLTTMFINERMDAGDIIAQEQEEIRTEDTAATLSARLADKGAKLLLETIEMIRHETAPRTKQDAASATYAPMLKKNDGRLDWKKPARELANRVRAFQPWPVCFFMVNGATIRVLQARVETNSGQQPGTVLETKGEGLLIQTGTGALRLLELQPEGKKAMSGKAFLCGNKITKGELLL
jgi:methionyl-tRNA formyltransferase